MSNPLSAVLRSIFAWPLIKRELLGLLRTRRAFWLLLASLVLSCLLPLLQWPSGSGSVVFFNRNLVVFLTFVITQLVAALLIVPAFTAAAIAGEREQDTYELLYSTLLAPSSIVISKFLGALGYIVLLLLATAPVACLLFMLGGLEFSTVLKSYAVIFASVLSSGIVCLTVSMRCRRTTTAAIRGYTWVAFWNIGVYLLLMLTAYLLWETMQRSTGQPLFNSTQALSLVSGTSPFPVLPQLVFGDGMAGPTWSSSWVTHLGYCALVSIGHFAYLLRRVRTPDAPDSRRRRFARGRSLRTRPDDAATRRRPKLAWTTRTILRRGKRRMPPVDNPVLLKELRTEFFGRARYRGALFWIPLALFVLVILANRSSDRAVPFVISMIALGAITLIVPGAAATCVTREIEQGNFDLLRSTLVPMRRLLLGKLLGTFFSGLGITCAAVWALIGSHLVFARENPALILMVTIVFLVTTLFLTCLGVFFSVTSHRSVAALVKTYAATIGAFLLTPLFLSLMIRHGEVGLFVFATNPFATSLRVLSEYVDGHPSEELIAIFGLFLMFYAAGCAVLWTVSASLFDDPRRHD